MDVVRTLLLCVLALLVNLFGLHGQISQGFSITAGSDTSWRSHSGDYAFGFYRVFGCQLYLAGIWFDKIPAKTLVWTANRDSPVTDDGHLILTYTNGTVQQIYSGTTAAASFGLMQDDGNFVLRDTNSALVWQSFGSPTDTILPEQNLANRQTLDLLQFKGNYGLLNRRFQVGNAMGWETGALGLSLCGSWLLVIQI